MAVLRKDVPPELTWNLEDIFVTAQAWESDYADLEAMLPKFQQFSGIDNSKQLADYLRLRGEVLGRMHKLVSYAYFKVYEDQTNSESMAMYGRSEGLQNRLTQALIPVRNALLQWPDGRLEACLQQEPELSDYRWYVERLIKARAHRLAPAAESALAALGNTLASPGRIYQTFTAGDMKFDPVHDAQGNEFAVSLWSYFTQVETSPDTVLRRAAFASLTEGLRRYQHGVGAVMTAEIDRNVATARMRGYASTAEMLLNDDADDSRQADHAPVAVFDQALDIIQTELAPHMRRYARLRKRVLGLDKLLYCDVKAPLDVNFNQTMTFQEAGHIITEAVGVLGAEYQDRMRKACTERWVYQADNVGRGMIAFGGSVPGVHGYSFYPWGGNLYDVPLLGHELGHAVHFDLAGRSQNYTNWSAALLFAEAPSTLNEHLVVNYLRKTSQDTQLHRWLDMYLMMSYHHNFVTHILEAELLRRLYRMAEDGQSLSAGVIGETKGAVLGEFWGDTVEIDEGAKLTWMRQPHYYRGLYPYTYSVGLAASTVLSRRMENQGQAAGAAWVDVLKLGGSRSAFDLFKAAGLDMSSPDVYRDAVAYVGRLVDRLEQSFEGVGQ